MLSKIIAVPLAIGGLFFLYMTWEVDTDYALYIIPFAVLGAIVFTFSPQIDWWWYHRNPPELEGPIRKLLSDHLAYYTQLSVQNKKLFRERMALYIRAQDFSPMVLDNFPDDLKAIIAAQAVQIGFGQGEFLFAPYEHLILYPEAFPSPQYPVHRHSTEHFEEDGVLMFSARHLMNGFLYPKSYLPIGLYEFARLY
ncbi:MAG: zinc-dependent peptidase, partial [Phaeodactylibacter sp.]|nr:zinc-dependent peptidase [Phaeodactylibacter sp.]